MVGLLGVWPTDPITFDPNFQWDIQVVIRTDHPKNSGHIFHWKLSRIKPTLFKGHSEEPIKSGQIIATSHDLTPHGKVVGEPCLKWPYFREIQVGEIL